MIFLLSVLHDIFPAIFSKLPDNSMCGIACILFLFHIRSILSVLFIHADCRNRMNDDPRRIATSSLFALPTADMTPFVCAQVKYLRASKLYDKQVPYHEKFSRNSHCST